MKKYNVLILGSGGREHALAWKISQSRMAGKLIIAPGNAGTAGVGVNRELDVNDFEGIGRLVKEEDIQLLVVGPEEPLVRGIHDYFLNTPELSGCRVIGPTKAGAALEGSKDFAKQFMVRHGIPTAAYQTFDADHFTQGLVFLRTLKAPYVLKADGLAAGKGVIICNRLEDAEEVLRTMLVDKKFGHASNKVVIEEFLQGIELSAFALVHEGKYIMLPSAKDYKRIGIGDTGPNTGGMGSVSPVPFADAVFMKKVEQRIIHPTVEGLRKEGITYSGFLFAGLMNVGGDPFVIEYNVRMGDPETEAIMPRIQSDLLEILVDMDKAEGTYPRLEVDPRIVASIMMVSGGYPGNYNKGFPIILPTDPKGSMLFHAGTKWDTGSGKVITAGGRVMAVSSYGNSVREAVNKSLKAIQEITFESAYYRSDIGFDLEREKEDMK